MADGSSPSSILSMDAFFGGVALDKEASDQML